MISIDLIKKFFKKEHPGIRIVEDDDGDKIIFDGGERSLIIGRHRGDIIDGYGGDDIIVSRGGHDTLLGDEGADRFVFFEPTQTGVSEGGSASDGASVIFDFSRAEEDVIDLSFVPVPEGTTLTFRGELEATPNETSTFAPYSVYYRPGIRQEDYPFPDRYPSQDVIESRPGVTLLANLSDSEAPNPNFMLLIWGVRDIEPGDLVLIPGVKFQYPYPENETESSDLNLQLLSFKQSKISLEFPDSCDPVIKCLLQHLIDLS